MTGITTDFVVGGVARNDDYYFRKAFVDDVWDSLKKDNVLLLAPRRTGKTSVMYHMLDSPEHGYRVIHLNVEDIGTPSEFYLSLIDAIKEHQPEYLKKLSSSWDLLKGLSDRLDEVSFWEFKIKLRQATKQQHWKTLAQQLMEKVIESDEPVLFIIDELPDMLSAMAQESPENLKAFLHQFRKMRINPRGGDKIRWLVGGSVNIRGTLDEFGLINQINDLKTEILPALCKQEVVGFISMMLDERGVKYDKNLTARICELLGEPIPYFLQLFTQELCRYWRREKPEILGASHADKVFQHALLGEAAHDKLQHYHSRIQLYYPQQEHDAAYGLLDALALSSANISEKGLFGKYQQLQLSQSTPLPARQMQHAFRRLLLRLESDFYISKLGDGGYGFNSYLLKTWWRKNWAYDSE